MISPKFSSFYLVLDNADWIERLVPLGLKLVQLRLKNQTNENAYAEIIRAKNICEKYNCQLIVNDYWQAAIDLGCDYIHLGQEDLDIADMPAIKKANIKIGLSTHNRIELDRALSFMPNYIALGPIFKTSTKLIKHQPQGLEKLAQWKKIIGALPLIAIGGIKVEDALNVINAGADSIAIISDVTKNIDPELRTKTWLNTVCNND